MEEIEVYKSIKRKIRRYPYRPTCALSHIFAFSNMSYIGSIKKFIETIDQHNIDRENSMNHISCSLPLEYLNSYEDIGIEKTVNIVAMLGCNKKDLRVMVGRILILKQEVLEDSMLLMPFAYCSNSTKYEKKIRKSSVLNLFNSIGKIKVKKINNARFSSCVEASNCDLSVKQTYYFSYLASFEIVNPVYIQLELRNSNWIRLE